MVRVLINVPKRVKRNEAFDVKLLISHPMESGQRRDAMGQAIPRDIMTHGQPVRSAPAADARLDRIERGNALQCLHRDRRLRLGQIVKASPYVAPARRRAAPRRAW